MTRGFLSTGYAAYSYRKEDDRLGPSAVARDGRKRDKERAILPSASRTSRTRRELVRGPDPEIARLKDAHTGTNRRLDVKPDDTLVLSVWT
jgi:hypothetical protein